MASLSCSYALRASNSNITNQITTMEKNIKTYADKMDFINMKLILGFNGEKSVSVAFTGLNATIQSIGVFLGGYYSVLPKTTIAQYKSNKLSAIILANMLENFDERERRRRFEYDDDE